MKMPTERSSNVIEAFTTHNSNSMPGCKGANVHGRRGRVGHRGGGGGRGRVGGGGILPRRQQYFIKG
jgi:hypothetical protein